MLTTTASSNALLAIRRGMERLDRSAAEVARGGDHGSPAAPLVEARQARLQTEAAVDVIRAEDDMLGTLLDEKA